MKDILYQFIEGQSHFGKPKSAKISLVLNEDKWIALHSISKHCFQACSTSGKKLLILYGKT